MVESFDHDRTWLEAGLILRLSRKARLNLDTRYEVRQYDERLSRSLNGDDALGNPELRYDLASFGAELQLRPLRIWRLSLIWQQITRSDEFLDYNTYVQTVYRIRSRLELGRVLWSLSLKYWDRDFDNAFVFDDIFNPETGEINLIKFYETVDYRTEVRVRLKKRFGLLLAVKYIDQATADPRFGYVRSQYMTGVTFSY